MQSYKLRTARKHVSPEERKTYIENGTLPSSILTYAYNAGGLVTQVKKNNVPLVKFFYNDRNHRVKKETYGGTNGDKILSTHYVRDVGGQVMAIYNEPQNGTPKVAEYPVYGSGRIGIYKPGSTPKTLYELTDHLGNVRTIFSVTDTNPGLTNEGYSDYYPFGMPMPGRNMVGNYRYAFQGQEKDSETGKEAFELRLWDSRIGRWLSPDPAGQYASPYLGMGNNPMNGVDSDGAFWEEFFNWVGSGFKADGWNSNAALAYQANGGTLGEWTGNKFSGYRSAGSTIDGEFVGTTFNAVNDFWNYDAFGLNGKVAVGYTRDLGPDFDFGYVGVGGSVLNISASFLGGPYGNYTYDFVGWEAGLNGGIGVGGSVEYAVEGFVSIYMGPLENVTPEDFAGPFGAFELSAAGEAGFGGGLQGSLAYGGGWVTIGVGGAIGFGAKASVMGNGRYGRTYLVTPLKPTNSRTIYDNVLNKIIHSIPIIPVTQSY